MWTLGRIWIYPIKSLPGVAVDRALLLPAGNLEHDREFALIDEEGRFMNAKRTPEIHRVRTTWDLQNWQITLSEYSAVTGEPSTVSTFHLDRDRREIADWFSAFFEMPLTLVQQAAGGFPDDTESPGPTLVSTASLGAVASWFPEIDPQEMPCRFRANFELEGGEPFGEDILVATGEGPVPFQVGDVTLFGTNPCQRCVVPTRSPLTGQVSPGFQKQFANHRESDFTHVSKRARFNHFYRLSINTQVRHSQPQLVRVGDPVHLT